MTEVDDGDVGSLLAARVARCIQRTLDPLLDDVAQILVVADETQRAAANRLVGSAPVQVVTNVQAWSFIVNQLLKSHRGTRS